MADIKSWLPIPDETGNFKEISGWDVILKQIYLVLTTPVGSRQWQPKFGCKIREYLFEHSDQKENILNEVKQAFRWLPHVVLTECNVSVESLKNRTGFVANISIVVGWNNEQLPVNIAIPSTLDDLDGTIYNVGIHQ